MKRKKFIWLTMLLILVVPLLIYVFISFYDHKKDLHIPDGETTVTITGEIRDIVIHDERATLYLEINEKVVAVKLQEDTLLQNAMGQNCTYQDLLIGLTVEALVNPTVWYDAWQDTEIGEQYEINVYYKCYKILIK